MLLLTDASIVESIEVGVTDCLDCCPALPLCHRNRTPILERVIVEVANDLSVSNCNFQSYLMDDTLKYSKGQCQHLHLPETRNLVITYPVALNAQSPVVVTIDSIVEILCPVNSIRVPMT